jgi:membrane fusion protein, multidrug efflux system
MNAEPPPASAPPTAPPTPTPAPTPALPPSIPDRGARRVRVAGVGLAVLLVAAAGGWLIQRGPSAVAQPRAAGASAAAAGASAAAAAPVPVVVAPARRTDDALAIDTVGSARALRSAALRPAAAGEVQSLHFRAGDRVRAGQRLLQLVDRRERLAVDLAAAEVDIARRLMARYAGTEGSGAVPGSVIDNARADLQRAEIALAQAREALADRVLAAPFAGVMGLNQVNPGDRVGTDTLVATLDDRRRLELSFELPESYLARVKAGDTVQATSVAFAGRTFEGRVTQIDSRVAEDTRALHLRAELLNTDDLLRPGQSFTVRLLLPGAAHLQVPELALQWGRDGGHVWALRAGRAVQVPVSLVRRLEGSVLIDGDLQPGEPVVVEGVQRLRPGRAVSVVTPTS